MPGETIQIIDGEVYIDGQILGEEYGTEVMQDAGIAEVPVTLGEDEYFVLGDNRNHSMDSRDSRVGILKREDLVGRAWVRIWPFSEFAVIMREAVAVGIGIVSPARIDEINILQATYEAMREAVGKLCVEPNVLLNDAVTIPMIPSHIVQVPIIKGDAKSVSIAAASIVAKVTRDRLMTEYEEVLPGYGFASNKGYGSSEHIAALKKYGPTPIHRRSFIHNFI